MAPVQIGLRKDSEQDGVETFTVMMKPQEPDARGLIWTEPAVGDEVAVRTFLVTADLTTAQIDTLLANAREEFTKR